MKELTTFIGRALIFRRDSHTYFDWIIEYTFNREEKKYFFVFTENYQIENYCFEELVKRDLIRDIQKKNPNDKKFFFEEQFEKAVQFISLVEDNDSDEVKPRDDLFLQLNIKSFNPEYVLFDFMFFGYKYIRRDINMPMELFNEFLDRSNPKIRFTKNFKVFVAHASEDKALAREIATDLTSRGYSCWFDEWEIKVGDSIIDKINHGIKEVSFMIVLFSPSSLEKPWVKKEMNAGFMQEMERKKVYVLPVLLKDCSIPPLFSDKRYADFTASYEQGLREILKSL